MHPNAKNSANAAYVVYCFILKDVFLFKMIFFNMALLVVEFDTPGTKM